MPFTTLRIVENLIDKRSQSILDIGCGKGKPMKFINRKQKYLTIGADIFKPYIDICRAHDTHYSYVQCDAKNPPFSKASFDTVICLEMLEHMNRDEGLKLLASFEEIARLQVIVTTPLIHFDQGAYDCNQYQEHKYIWAIGEFRELGYTVITSGIRGIHNYPPFLQYPLWILASPFTRYLSQIAGQAVCVKDITAKK